MLRTVWIPAVALTLTACGGGDSTPKSEPSPPPAAVQTAGLDGKAEYEAVCVACHGAEGAGVPGAFPPLAGSEWVTGDARRPIAVALHGLEGELQVKGATYNGVMAGWKALSDEQLAAILTYARSSWGNSAAPVTAAQVAEVGAATAARTSAWTVAQLEREGY